MKAEVITIDRPERLSRRIRTTVQLSLAILALFIMVISTYESHQGPIPHADYFLNPLRVILEPLPVDDVEFIMSNPS